MMLAVMIIGLIWCAFGLIMGAKDIPSKLVFNVFPFFSGAFTVIVAIHQMGLIVIP